MKKQKILKVTGVLVLIMIMVIEAVLIYRLHQQDKQNVVTVGNVAISLYEPEYEKLKANRETGETERIKPGEKILRDPTIEVKSGSQMAYLRTRIVVGGLTEYQRRDLLERVELEAGWTYNPKDGYYYFNDPVQEGQEVRFFKSIVVPQEWEGMKEKMEFRLQVWAEAVQASYLTPKIDTQCRMVGWTPTQELLEAKGDMAF